MIHIRSREIGKEVKFIICEDNEVTGELTAENCGNNLLINKIWVKKDSASMFEFLIKSCVNYSINRSILNIVLNYEYEKIPLIWLGFKDESGKMVYHIPPNLVALCKNTPI